jgi:hypothetical protein
MKDEKRTPMSYEKIRGPSVSLKVPRGHFDQLVGIALVENTSLAVQMREAIARYLTQKFTDPQFIALLEEEMINHKKLLPPPLEEDGKPR